MANGSSRRRSMHTVVMVDGGGRMNGKNFREDRREAQRSGDDRVAGMGCGLSPW